MIPREYQMVTVFGAGGFIGRYVCEKLLDADVRVRASSREPRHAHFIQPLGRIGQWGLVKADVTRPETLREALHNATAAVNLVGVLKGDFHRVHVEGARNLAEAARQEGVKALVHVSAIGADPNSESAYGKTKAAGEQAVREAFPGATILRPSVVFGPEDNFTNRLAAFSRLPVLPVIAPNCRLQPVYVHDIAKAIARAALDPETHRGKTYEIAGSQVMTMRELAVEILKCAERDTELVETPDFVSSLMSRFGFLPGAPLTRDQWRMLQQDNVASNDAPGLEAFGIDPTPFAAVAPEWLGPYGGSRFARRRVNMTATS